MVQTFKVLRHPKSPSCFCCTRIWDIRILRCCPDIFKTKELRYARPWRLVSLSTSVRLSSRIRFNDRIGIDGSFWTGRGQFQCYVLHVHDEATGFHLAKRLDGQNMDHVIPALNDLWIMWPGNPKQIYLDPAVNFDRMFG